MSYVLSQLVVIREAGREAPSVVNFGDAELVERCFAVDTRTRVPVPVPCAAEVRACLIESLVGFEGQGGVDIADRLQRCGRVGLDFGSGGERLFRRNRRLRLQRRIAGLGLYEMS